jgi:hypothetical protein
MLLLPRKDRPMVTDGLKMVNDILIATEELTELVGNVIEVRLTDTEQIKEYLTRVKQVADCLADKAEHVLGVLANPPSAFGAE